MHCKDVAERIEALAAGEIELDAESRAHLDACPQCSSALALARQVNALLTTDVPHVPRHFTASVLQRLPSRTPDIEEGLGEEGLRLDAWFDTVTIASVVPIAIGVWLLIDPVLLQGIGLPPGLGNILTGYAGASIAAVIAILAWDFAEEL
jgi:hypothetical protein